MHCTCQYKLREMNYTVLTPQLGNKDLQWNAVTHNTIKIDWTPQEANTKSNEHYSELERVIGGGHIKEQLERQRLVGACFTPPKFKLTTPVQSVMMHINYKPQCVLKAGFDTSPDVLRKQKSALAKDLYLAEFLRFPEPGSNSILFHSLQGNLRRKRDTMLSQGNETKVETLEVPLPAITTKVESSVDFSMFLQLPNPTFLESVWMRLTQKAPQPLFWKRDEDITFCNNCHQKFTIFYRKHHCRLCGNIYCSSCSASRIPFTTKQTTTLERACQMCL